METTPALYASASFRKVPGTLKLGADGVLTWKPSSSNSTVRAFCVHDTHLKGLKVSKPGAAQVALRLETEGPHRIHGETIALITFNAEGEKAFEDRERFKERLAAAIARARAETTRESTAPAASRRAGTPEMSEVKLRSQVLLANPNLLTLHKEVVGNGTISDADFWAHPARSTLLRAERARMEQRLGRRAQIADPHPTQNEAGEMKINITPQLIRDLFEQYPVLTRAYDENVPSKMNENTFWVRYFQSKLYHRLRKSLRSTATEPHLPDDDVFDKYLEDEDDGLEPRQAQNPHDALLDLGATQEDHSETGNIQDWTMRAGFDRRTLPLMRHFNAHAASLLSSSLGELSEKDARRVRRKTGGVGEEYSSQRNGSRYDADIVLDDLTEHRASSGRRLEIHDPRAYFDVGQEAAVVDPAQTEVRRKYRSLTAGQHGAVPAGPRDMDT